MVAGRIGLLPGVQPFYCAVVETWTISKNPLPSFHFYCPFLIHAIKGSAIIALALGIESPPSVLGESLLTEASSLSIDIFTKCGNYIPLRETDVKLYSST